jgi:hypothetical protein
MQNKIRIEYSGKMVKVQHDQLKEWSFLTVNIVMISVILIGVQYVHIQWESATSDLVISSLYNHSDERKAQSKLTVKDLVTVFLLTELVTPESGFFTSNIFKN